MTRKGVFPIVATLAVIGVVLAVFSQTVMRDSNISTNTMTTEQAYADLSGKMKRIGVQEVSVNPQQLDVSEFLDAKDELPDIDSSYPFVVEGNGDVNIEIFSSGEKAAEPAHLYLPAGWTLVRTEIHCRRAAELPRSRDFWRQPAYHELRAGTGVVRYQVSALAGHL